ncbi:MAG: VOC family protein [Patescibacteria group bacterium]
MNRVVHFEIYASDPEKLIAFYTAVFGWEIKKWENPAGDYWFVMTGPQGSTEGGISGGLMRRKGTAPQGGEPVNSFVCTIGVSNVDEYIQKALDAGGTVASPKVAIPGMAWLAYLKDTDGNIFGIFEENKNAK